MGSCDPTSSSHVEEEAEKLIVGRLDYASKQNGFMEVEDRNESSIADVGMACHDVAFCPEAGFGAGDAEMRGSEVDSKSKIGKGVEPGSEQLPDIECRVSRLHLAEAECISVSNSCGLDPPELGSMMNVEPCGKVAEMCPESLSQDTVPHSFSPCLESNHEGSTEVFSLKRHAVVMEEKDGTFIGLEANLSSEVSLRDADEKLVQNGPPTIDLNIECGSTALSNIEMFNGTIGVANSASTDDISCSVRDVGKDHDKVGDACGAKLLGDQSSSLRRSSRCNKYVRRAEKHQEARKGSKKPSNISWVDGAMDFFLKTARRKRSCSRKSSRSSCWGFMTNLSKNIVQDCGATTQEIQNQNSRKVKGCQRSRILKKSKASTSVRASNKTKSIKPITLRIVYGKKADQSAVQVTSSPGLAGVDISNSGDKGITGDNVLDSSLPDMKLENSKDVIIGQKMSQMSPFCFPGNNFDESMACQKPVEEDHFVDKDGDMSIPSNKAAQKLCSSLSFTELDKSCYTNERVLDSGTSPDSEVINNVIDSQVGPLAQEVHNSAVDSFDCNANSEVPDSSKKTSKKGNGKYKVSQANNLLVENGVSCPAHMVEGKVSKKSRQPQKKGKSKELHPLTGAPGHKVAKNSKSTAKCRDKSRISASAISEEETSHQCDLDKQKIGKEAIVRNDLYDEACKMEVSMEAGKDADDEATSNSNSGVTCGDASSQVIVPSGDSEGPQRLALKDAWVCCDNCDKWRRIPAALADSIEKTNCKWTCKDNHDKAFADCSIPQEKSDADINTELEISDEEDARNTYLGSKIYERSHATAYQPPSWTHVNSNLFLHRGRKTQTMDEVMVCCCKRPQDGKLGCRNGCLNRMLNIECVRGTCPCGDLCSNQQFQRQKYAKLKLFRCGKKGHGLQVLEDISKEQFIIEYVGEVLDLPTYDARQRDYALNGHKHFYFMTLNGNEVIDACAKGNLGRYINHSCQPNCRTEKWMVNGEICIGLFAVRNISKGEELTFDYNYVRVFGAAAKKCYCGAAKCRGYIGGDLLNAEVIVQGDSDDEDPDPVVLYENGEIQNGLENINAVSCHMDVEETRTEVVAPTQTLLIPTEDADMAMDEEKSVTTVVEQLVAGPGKGSFDESLVNLSNVDDSLQTDDVSEKSASDHQQEIPLGRQMVDSCSIQKDSSSENGRLKKCSSVHADAGLARSETEMAESKQVHSKFHPRMKISRSSRPMKNHNTSSNISDDDKASMAKMKYNVTPIKLKKMLGDAANHKLEAVEEKLNGLLDVDGGICKRKDASRGYLKLLLLTAASGDNGNGGAIQRTRDLSMILDAMLKTKSRGVLVDIINKNGLQMLHNMMKQYRRDFNKIPILRKLLKVLEFLAEKDILTGERINADPRCLGVESLRESLLALTEHQDKKVHQIARSFRDKWIPRVRKISAMDKDDRKVEVNRSVGLHHRWRDHEKRPSEAIDCTMLAIPTDDIVAARMEEGPSPQKNSCVTMDSVTRKRKSRWDQPSDQCSPCKGQKLQHINVRRRIHKSFTDRVRSSAAGIKYCTPDGGMDMKEDAPPGFSSPPPPGFSSHPPVFSPPPPGFSSHPCGSHLPSSGCSTVAGVPWEVSRGELQERFNSRLPVSYGIPFLAVQQYGTPQREQLDGWVVAPGVPFHPFPPLPPNPRECGDEGGQQDPVAAAAERAVSQDRCVPNSYQADQDIPSTSGSTCYGVVAAPVASLHHQHVLQQGGGNSGSLGRRYFRHQKWRNSRPGPPWLRRNEWGFKGNYPRNGGLGGAIPMEYDGNPS